uniref:Uncharacterized protein n=1 Tax=Ascaris lumbricoides TaxID=6252 RepID=A0A9J2P7W0_ASCLU
MDSRDVGDNIPPSAYSLLSDDFGSPAQNQDYEDDEDFFAPGMGIRSGRSQSFGGVTQYCVQRLRGSHNYYNMMTLKLDVFLRCFSTKFLSTYTSSSLPRKVWLCRNVRIHQKSAFKFSS